jgi:ketosteroid isomerase-like protein
MTAEEVAMNFIDAINRHNVDDLYDLMTEDHLFIDGMGDTDQGRDNMKTGWMGYFTMVPDFLIEVSETIVADNTVALFGMASGTYTSDGTIKPENYWKTPAAWHAVVSSEKVKEWQVFADNEPIRQIMRRETKSYND